MSEPHSSPELLVTFLDAPRGRAPGPAPEEMIDSLRQMIASKEEVALLTVAASVELHRELENARAEAAALREQLDSKEKGSDEDKIALNDAVVKLTSQFNHERKTIEREHNKLRSELASSRTRWEQTQKLLENEKRSRQLEATRASGKIVSLERDVASAWHAVGTGSRGPSRKLSRVAMTVLGVVTTAAAAAFAWSRIPVKPQRAKPSLAIKTPEIRVNPSHVLQVEKAARIKPVVSDPSPSSHSSPHQIPGALSRLNDALAGFPISNPEEALREVRRRVGDPSVCAFQWRGGQPALLYRTGTKSVSLASTLSDCAQAIETARTK